MFFAMCKLSHEVVNLTVWRVVVLWCKAQRNSSRGAAVPRQGSLVATTWLFISRAYCEKQRGACPALPASGWL